MSARPEQYRYESQYGLVAASYDTWEVDIIAAGGGVLQRVPVLGPRLPEKSTPERPQWVMYGHAGHQQGQAWCIPMASQLAGPRSSRRGWTYYDEVGNYRITIDRDGVYEIRNSAADAAPIHRVVIDERDGSILLETPTTRLRLRESDSTLDVEVAHGLTIVCESAVVECGTTAEVTAGASVSVSAPAIEIEGAATVAITAPAIAIEGVVTLTGTLAIV